MAFPPIRVHLCLSVATILFVAFSFTAPAFSAPKKPPAVQPAAMMWAEPWAIAPGKTADVTFHGEGLGQPIGLWAGFPAEAAPVDNQKNNGQPTYRIRVPTNVPVGIGAVRLLTSTGASQACLLMIDDLPTISQKRGNNSPRDAQTIVAPVAIEGVCQPNGFDYYRLFANKGQRLSFEIVAQRLGARMDPLLRLLDVNGRELAYCDDAPGAGSDSRFGYTFPQDGQYLIELRDVNYDGGSDCRCHLRVGDFPIAIGAFPDAGETSAQRFFLECDDGSRLGPIALPAWAQPPGCFISASRKPAEGSGFFPVTFAESNPIIESEPNDTPEKATKIAIPSTVIGRLDRAGDQDFYQFTASKGQHVSFRAATRSIGSMASLSLRLLKSDGSTLAESKPEAADEGMVDAVIPSDDIYHLLVTDLNRAGGPGMIYHIQAEQLRPGFSLSVESEHLNAAPGGTVALKVTAVRRDYAGPITLSLRGDGPSLALENQTIPKGKLETDLQIKLPEDLKLTKPLIVNIVGKATIGDDQVEQTAGTLPALKLVFPRLPYPPPELDGVVAIGIRQSKK